MSVSHWMTTHQRQRYLVVYALKKEDYKKEAVYATHLHKHIYPRREEICYRLIFSDKFLLSKYKELFF